jgi:hypothetical protein
MNGYYGTVGIIRAGATAVLAPHEDVNTVGSVVPGSAAARAHIAPGDVAVPLAGESALVVQRVFHRIPAAAPIQYVVIHHGQRRIVSLVPSNVRTSMHDDVLIIAQLLRGILIVLIGAALVLLRPSIMTAAFFVLCLQFGELTHPTGNLELVAGVPYFWKPLFLVLTCIVTGAGPAVAAVFCVRFPTGEPLPLWRPVEKLLVTLASFTILAYFFALLAGGTYTQTGSVLYRAFTGATLVAYTIAALSFLARYRAASGEDRQRLRWVAIGLGSFLLSYTLFWIAQNVPAAPTELSTWAQFINVLPLTVLYAIVRHHVIDVRVAGGRAIAFAMLSAIPVAFFSIADWALSNRLQNTRLGSIVEVCVAIAFGFWVNSIQHRIDAVIESVFFRHSRIAEERLRSVALQIAHARNRTDLAAALVNEPFEALELVSSVLFLERDGTFEAAAQRGSPADAPARLDAGAHLPAQGRNSLQFPIFVQRERIGLLVVGAKNNGERFDTLERAALQNLVESAALTYGQLQTTELQQALEKSRLENRSLRESAG